MKIKTITLCGSMKIFDRIVDIQKLLTNKGLSVHIPTLGEVMNYSTMTRLEKAIHKNEMIVIHLNKIRESDAILIVNEKQRDVEGYIGSNSFLEMGFAFVLQKKIFILNKVPDQSNTEEILGLEPVELLGNLHRLVAE